MKLEDRLDETQRRKLQELLRAVPQDVDSTLVKYGEEGVTAQTCLRWLKARKWDVKLAKKELINHAAWRLQPLCCAWAAQNGQSKYEQGAGRSCASPTLPSE
eukprot:scaffold198529_cov27-Tisochrysis_lutea.AAC.1